MIAFNRPFLTGKETDYISQAVSSGKISGNGNFTQLCHAFFQERYGFKKCLLTTSCTDALEMAALLIGIKEGDEVIIPSYTFVSTANAFALRGARIIFADSGAENPNIDSDSIESLITEKTRAIVVVHYAGIACDMDKIMSMANKHSLFVVEDAAQAVDSFYKGKPLGSIGHFGAFSFHETKNIISGEGGMLVVNDEKFFNRADIIWEKGTNRTAFSRGEIDKYGWVDVGSSFLPSEIIAAFLYAQLENMETIQEKRKALWDEYYSLLKPLEVKGSVKLPFIPNFATNNSHMFYLIVTDVEIRDKLLSHMKENGVWAIFHYLSLHKSPYYKDKYKGQELRNSDRYTECLLRLPLFYDLTMEQIAHVVATVRLFFESNKGQV